MLMYVKPLWYVFIESLAAFETERTKNRKKKSNANQFTTRELIKAVSLSSSSTSVM